MKLKESRLLGSGAVLLCVVSGVSKVLQSSEIACPLKNAASQTNKTCILSYNTVKTSILQVKKYTTCNNKFDILISQYKVT
jgi:hypothetical protein